MLNTALIIPCYNEENRLPIDEFLRAADQYYLIFVNDGSSDDTKDYLKKLTHQNVAIINLPENVGKANAVRAGMLSFAKDEKFKQVQWMGFLDADLATPIEEIKEFHRYRETFHIEAKSIWGSRIYKLGSHIERKARRHYVGRIFATAAHLICGIETYDSQCGAKIFHVSLVEKAFKEPFLSRWLFDIEIYLRLKNEKIVEYPLKYWKDVDGSKVSLFGMLFKTIPELWRIRQKYKS